MGPGMFAGVDTFIKVGLWVMAISVPLHWGSP